MRTENRGAASARSGRPLWSRATAAANANPSPARPTPCAVDPTEPAQRLVAAAGSAVVILDQQEAISHAAPGARQIMCDVVVRAIGSTAAGLVVGWGRLERTGRESSA